VGARRVVLAAAVFVVGACASSADEVAPDGTLIAGSLPPEASVELTWPPPAMEPFRRPVTPVAPAMTRSTPGPASTTSTTSSTTTTTSTPTTVEGPRTFTAAFTGDTLVHSPLWDQAARNAGGSGFDFDPMLARLRPLLDDVDLTVCHLETPIAPAGEPFSTAPMYGVPVEVVDAIDAAGYDRCSTASNHTIDRGVAGVDRTIAALQAAGLGQSGMASTPAELEPSAFDVRGVAVSHLSYTFSFNGMSLPDDQPWRSAAIDPVRIVADAGEARRRGAEVVVVSLHWGNEGMSDVTDWQRSIAEQITAGGAVDLIVGHHAHVVQPIEQINGTWVVYGLGNILSNLSSQSGWPASSQDGMVAIVAVTVHPDGDVQVWPPAIYPTWVDIDAGWIVRLVGRDLADPATDAGLRARLAESLARTRSVVGDHVAQG